MTWLVFALPIPLYLIAYVMLTVPAYEMDPPRSPAAFIGIYTLYSRLFYFIFTFGMVGAAVIVGYTHQDQSAISMLAAALYALLTNGFMIYFYENYLHSRYVTGISTYTRSRYALVLALAFSSVILFVLGTVLAFREV